MEQANACPETEEELPLDLTLSMTNMSGHTEMSFSKDLMRLKWEKTSVDERGLIRGLVQSASLFGFVPWTVDEDGKPKEKVKKLPGLFRGKTGEIVLKGTVKKVKLFSLEMIAGELKDGRIVMEAKKDGTWKIIKPGDYKPEGGKKRKIVSSAAVGGG